MHKKLAVVFDREVDDRWIAEIPVIAGALAYGSTEQEAHRKAVNITKHTSLIPA